MRCWICGKPKGQGPDRCAGHYDNLQWATRAPSNAQLFSNYAVLICLALGVAGAVVKDPVMERVLACAVAVVAAVGFGAVVVEAWRR